MNKRQFCGRTTGLLLGWFCGQTSPRVRAATPPPTPGPVRGIPGARNLDHVGLTVPDLDEAVGFFTEVLGADLLFRFDEGPGTENPADLRQTFDVDPADRLKVAMLRLGPNLNVELMQYEAPRARREVPKNDDVDVPHLAFFVDDLTVAAEHLAAHGCTLLGGPFTSGEGPKAGQAIRYARAPWGLALELLHRPEHMPYERTTAARLFGPAPAWTSNR